MRAAFWVWVVATALVAGGCKVGAMLLRGLGSLLDALGDLALALVEDDGRAG